MRYISSFIVISFIIISLLLQFYETGEQSLTLSKAVKKRLFKKNEIVRVFQDIVKTLEHIHNKGFPHNDSEER